MTLPGLRSRCTIPCRCALSSASAICARSQCLLERQRALHEPLRQRLAFQVLHDQVLGLALAADVVEGADVRVGELRDRLAPPARTAASPRRQREVLPAAPSPRPSAPGACPAPGRPPPCRRRRRAENFVGSELVSRRDKVTDHSQSPRLFSGRRSSHAVFGEDELPRPLPKRSARHPACRRSRSPQLEELASRGAWKVGAF